MEKVRVKHHYPLSSKTQKDQIEAFLWTEKDHLISYTHSYQKYVCTYGWVLSVKKISNLNFIWEKMLVMIHLTEKG